MPQINTYLPKIYLDNNDNLLIEQITGTNKISYFDLKTNLFSSINLNTKISNLISSLSSYVPVIHNRNITITDTSVIPVLNTGTGNISWNSNLVPFLYYSKVKYTTYFTIKNTTNDHVRILKVIVILYKDKILYLETNSKVKANYITYFGSIVEQTTFFLEHDLKSSGTSPSYFLEFTLNRLAPVGGIYEFEYKITNDGINPFDGLTIRSRTEIEII